jgi:predicted Rossmann fold nucleotide-binding protein DprA/Smf involved in DNA uptake
MRRRRRIEWRPRSRGCASRPRLVAWGDPDFPQPLLEIGDSPPVLYCMGRRELLMQPAFAIVGSRNATPQGCADAEAFAAALSAAGLAIVSGLALGIDAPRIVEDLSGSASSIAVIGTGPDRFIRRAIVISRTSSRRAGSCCRSSRSALRHSSKIFRAGTVW